VSDGLRLDDGADRFLAVTEHLRHPAGRQFESFRNRRAVLNPS
jgi:hypothetical protein